MASNTFCHVSRAPLAVNPVLCLTKAKGLTLQFVPELGLCLQQSCPVTEETGGADSSPLATAVSVHRKQWKKPPAWKSVTSAML